MRNQPRPLPVAELVKPVPIQMYAAPDTTLMLSAEPPCALIPPAAGGWRVRAVNLARSRRLALRSVLPAVLSVVPVFAGGTSPAAAASGRGYQLAHSLSGPDQPPPDPLVLFITSTSFKLIFAVCWILLALALYRRARSRNTGAVSWLVLALLIGPFAWIIFALRFRNSGNNGQEPDNTE